VVNTNTDQYNFQYNQGWITGTELQVNFNNSRTATDQPFTNLQSDAAVELYCAR
jgi:outer membrane protein